MASTIKLDGLKHYIESVERYSNLLTKFHEIVEMICQQAQEYAMNQYKSHERFDIQVYYEKNGKTASIYAYGDQVAFYEFGTGRVGENTYQGKKPTSGVPITESWIYFYPSSAKRVTKSGTEGWFWDKKFHRGIRAEAEMWETREFIKQEAKYIVRYYFESKGGGR